METVQNSLPRGVLPVDPSGDVSSSAQAQDILPHIFLFLVLIFAYFPPPVRFRSLLVWVLVAILEWRSTISAWPPNIGDTRPVKYGIASSWIFVLPVVQRILIHTPERDFWRLDKVRNVPTGEGNDASSASTSSRRPPMAAESIIQHLPPPPKEMSWEKLRWSISLFSTPRAVGWNFGSRTINAQREVMRQARLAQQQKPTASANACTVFKFPKGQFVATKLTRALVCYLVWDLVMVANRRVVVPGPDEWWNLDRTVMLRILWLDILMGITVYAGMNQQFDIAAAIGVSLGLNDPEDWPPLFGSLTDCYTISNVWGRFWHQYMRQPCLGFSHFLLAKLRTAFHVNIPKHNPLTYLFHLTVAFAISAFFHVLSVGAVARGFLPIRSLVADMSTFFMLQPPAAVLESVAGVAYERYVLAKLLRYVEVKGGGSRAGDANGGVVSSMGRRAVDGSNKKSDDAATPSTSMSRGIGGDADRNVTSVMSEWESERERQEEEEHSKERRRMAVLFWSAVLCRVVGYGWVFCWFYWTGRWFIRPYIGVGINEWQLPFSFADWLILPEKCRN